MFHLNPNAMKTKIFLPLFLLLGNICSSQTTTADSTATANGSGNESAAIETGISTPVSYKNDFRIYPNPATDHFNIDTKLVDYKLQIYNTKGEVIFEDKNQSKVEVSDMAPGIYFVTISDREGRQLIKKLVVQ
jgi:hypothetical protein